MYDYYVGLNHSKIEKYETNLDGSFDVDAFISNGKDKNVDMVLFSNPNNPTGHSITLWEMKKLVKRLRIFLLSLMRLIWSLVKKVQFVY